MDEIVQTKRKKGVVNKDNYDSEVRKLSKVKGLEHKTYKGKTVPARTTGKACK